MHGSHELPTYDVTSEGDSVWLGLQTWLGTLPLDALAEVAARGAVLRTGSGDEERVLPLSQLDLRSSAATGDLAAVVADLRHARARWFLLLLRVLF